MDAYDEQVKRLTERPELIVGEWEKALGIFGWVQPQGVVGGLAYRPKDGRTCGCLTMVRAGEEVAWTTQLTRAIRADKRIPTRPEDIKPKHLPLFCSWRRRIDRELAGK